MKSSLDTYNQQMAPARERFEASSGLNLIRSNTDPRLLESFLLYFCAIGAQMTEPVEGWIRRASERCAALGLSELSEGLARHAQAESGHNLMMVADLRSLAAHWNARHTPGVNADELLKQTPTRGARQYCQVHEDNITGRTPYSQIAIEYEIEQLPLEYGEAFIMRCLELFGPDIIPSLSFVTAHIELDIGHTKFNAKELAKLIDLVPDSLPALVTAASAALDAYAQFLTDCAQLAERHCNAHPGSLPIPSAFLSWQLRSPLEDPTSRSGQIPSWLEEVRSLRGTVLFDNGRRPQFRTNDGIYVDPDPIDVHAYHLLAYEGATLAGCVRIYPLSGGGPCCLTETLLGGEAFSEMLANLGSCREETIEIGRWVGNRALRSNDHLKTSIGVQLAAGAGAVARSIAKHAGFRHGLALFSVGTRDRQDAILSRFGLARVQGVEPVRCDRYDDDVQVMYCTGSQLLQPRFLRTMNAMANLVDLEQILSGSITAVSPS